MTTASSPAVLLDPLSVLLERPIVVADVETTREEIIEVGLIRFEAGRPPLPFTTLVKPSPAEMESRDAWAWNSPCHGIRPHHVRGAPPFVNLVGAIELYMKGAVMVAHNASFERRFFRKEYTRLGLRWQVPELCTLKLARRLCPGLDAHGGFGLANLAKIFGVVNSGPHRALPDSWTLAMVVFNMLIANSGRRDIRQVLDEIMVGSW